MPPQEIKGNFDERRGKLRQHILELEELNKSISQRLYRYVRIRENIEQVLDLTTIEAAKNFAPEKDIIAQASRWEKAYRNSQSDNLENAGKIRNRYNNCKADYREDELRKTISRLMSSRELLNVYLGKANIPVIVFKMDMNKQNSRLKLWEDAVQENSGAEKFVVFFSVLFSALMTYTRTCNMEALGADPDADTRVLIMDNPFGPIFIGTPAPTHV